MDIICEDIIVLPRSKSIKRYHRVTSVNKYRKIKRQRQLFRKYDRDLRMREITMEEEEINEGQLYIDYLYELLNGSMEDLVEFLFRI